jgi:myo-inositol 2-dehydrogenase/D-chiro-inositol 1-dehydrogenase
LIGALSIERAAHAAGSDEIKIALIGCGGRGSGAADQALSTNGKTKLVAMGDAFRDRLDGSLGELSKKARRQSAGC